MRIGMRIRMRMRMSSACNNEIVKGLILLNQCGNPSVYEYEGTHIYSSIARLSIEYSTLRHSLIIRYSNTRLNKPNPHGVFVVIVNNLT